jgi:hypothetical protein
MTVIARIEGKRMAETVVGAFAGDVCRGFATPVQIDSENSFYFLTLQGDGQETIVFKAMNTKTKEVKLLQQTASFVPNMVLGAFADPYLLTFEGADEVLEGSGDWVVSPNPFTDRLTVKFPDPSQSYQLTISDMMGKTVRALQVPSGVRKKEFTNEVSSLTAGVYLLTIQGGTEYYTVKLVKN